MKNAPAIEKIEKNSSNFYTDVEFLLIPKSLAKKHSCMTKPEFIQTLEHAKINKQKACFLPDEECIANHAGDCYGGMKRKRSFLTTSMEVPDPRFDTGVRPPCAVEMYWFLINDPNSEFSPNFGKLEECPTLREIVMRFTAFATQCGYFLPHAKNALSKKEIDLKFNPKIRYQATDEQKKIKTATPEPKDPNKLLSVDGAKFKGKPAKLSDSIIWVYNQLGVSKVDLETAPSPGAVALYQWANKGNNRTVFYTTLFTKVIPSQKDIDNQNKMTDDGTETFAIFDALMQDMEGDGSTN